MIIENILLTGASSGIGEALAYYYSGLSETKNLYLCGRNKERLENVVKKCKKNGKVNVFSRILDVTDKESLREWIYESESNSSLNLIIANAGVDCIEEITPNIYNTFNVNVMGVVNTITPAIEIYKKRQDKNKIIALMSSIAGYHGLAACPSYSASKACVKAYGESLRVSLLESNIQVNTICPGFVRSRITDRNTCKMPFFMEADKAANLIDKRIKKNVGLIAFPWQMRLIVWILSILPNILSDYIFKAMPKNNKVLTK